MERGMECGMERGMEYGMEHGMERGIEWHVLSPPRPAFVASKPRFCRLQYKSWAWRPENEAIRIYSQHYSLHAHFKVL